jgi:hypothetical protein
MIGYSILTYFVPLVKNIVSILMMIQNFIMQPMVIYILRYFYKFYVTRFVTSSSFFYKIYLDTLIENIQHEGKMMKKNHSKILAFTTIDNKIWRENKKTLKIENTFVSILIVLKIINTIPVILTQLVATSHYICRSRRTLHSLKVATNYLTKENYQYIKDLKITNILY